MQKLILILLLFCSCVYEAAKPGATVVEISKYQHEGLCLYVLDKCTDYTCIANNAAFIDTCGKFNIGDVVKYTK